MNQITGQIAKTCARCGAGFTAYGRENCCPPCKSTAPRVVVSGVVSLTSREWQVIALVHRALSNKAIGDSLCLAEGTIKEYLSRIFKKLKVANRTELALWASANLPAKVQYIA